MSDYAGGFLEQELVEALRLLRAANYGIVASCTFLVYDVVLTMGREISYIWRAEWTLPKALYLCVRYYGVAYLLTMTVFSLRQNSLQDCQHYYAWLTGGPIIFTAISNSILMLRVHALYNRSRRLLIFFVILQAAQFSTELFSTVRINSMLIILSAPLGLPFPGCPALGYDPRYTLIAWIPNLLTAAILFLMTLWNFLKSVRDCFRNTTSRFWHSTPLLYSLVRDGTVHFFMIVVALVVVLILGYVVQGPLGILVSPWMIAMYSISTSRLILHLRVFVAHQQGSTPTWHETFSIRIPPSLIERATLSLEN